MRTIHNVNGTAAAVSSNEGTASAILPVVKLTKGIIRMNHVYKLKATGRIAYSFPWESAKTPCPWNQSKYERVVIPFTEIEKRNSGKKVHIQVVRRDKLELVKNQNPKLS